MKESRKYRPAAQLRGRDIYESEELEWLADLFEAEVEEVEDMLDIDIMEARGPQPEDYVMTDTGYLGSLTTVSVVEDEFVGEFVEYEDAARAIREHANERRFWPNVWSISDHGNEHLVRDFGWDAEM